MTLPDSPGLCVFDEQGAGKTVTFIFAFDLLVERDQADLAVIVAPKSMIGEWPKDLEAVPQGTSTVRWYWLALRGRNDVSPRVQTSSSRTLRRRWLWRLSCVL